MSLSTGRHIHVYQWKEIPIDDYVLDHVEKSAEDEDQPVMTNGCPIFEWITGTTTDDKGDVKGETETYEGYGQGSPDTDSDEYQDMIKT